MFLAAHDDVDYAFLEDVVFDPENGVLEISNKEMLNYVKSKKR